jgi:hypothetical protein
MNIKKSVNPLILFIIIILSVLMIISCNYFTEPQPFENAYARPVQGGMSIIDYNTREICYDGKQIKDYTILSIIPDSSFNIINITDIYIDTVLLNVAHQYLSGRATLEYSYKNFWCRFEIENNIVEYFGSSWTPSRLKGNHFVKFICTMNNFNTGLQFFTPKKYIIEIELEFI